MIAGFGLVKNRLLVKTILAYIPKKLECKQIHKALPTVLMSIRGYYKLGLF